MPHLLHIDSSVRGDHSVSRKLTARAREAWAAAHPGGTVTTGTWALIRARTSTAATGMARAVAPELRTPAQAASWALTEELINEIKEADSIVLGLSAVQLRRTSSVKAWVDPSSPSASPSIRRLTPRCSAAGFRRPRQPRWRLRRRRAPTRMGPRGTLAAARRLDHRPGAALHHRRAHPRPHNPGDGRTDPTGREEPRRGRARHRRPVDPGTGLA